MIVTVMRLRNSPLLLLMRPIFGFALICFAIEIRPREQFWDGLLDVAGTRRRSGVGGRRRRWWRRRAACGDQAVEVDRHRKDDGRALLVGDLTERLQVAKLQRRRRLADDVRRVLERSRCLLLALCCDHLRPPHRHYCMTYFRALISSIVSGV